MNVEEKIREQPLPFRLRASMDMIGDMCKEGRCPKMSIPIQWEDEDVFISTTLQDALEIVEKYASPAAIATRYAELRDQGVIVEGAGHATVNLKAKQDVPTS